MTNLRLSSVACLDAVPKDDARSVIETNQNIFFLNQLFIGGVVLKDDKFTAAGFSSLSWTLTDLRCRLFACQQSGRFVSARLAQSVSSSDFCLFSMGPLQTMTNLRRAAFLDLNPWTWQIYGRPRGMGRSKKGLPMHEPYFFAPAAARVIGYFPFIFKVVLKQRWQIYGWIGGLRLPFMTNLRCDEVWTGASLTNFRLQ